MIHYLKGDVLKSPHQVIAHQVNCQGVMNSGIAKQIKELYPEVYVEYLETVNEYDAMGIGLLGLSLPVLTTDDRVIANLFSQDHYLPRTTCHTNYVAMHRAFMQLKDQLAPYEITEIAMPRIGCGLGGGEWKIVEDIIKRTFDDYEIYVYDLE